MMSLQQTGEYLQCKYWPCVGHSMWDLCSDLPLYYQLYVADTLPGACFSYEDTKKNQVVTFFTSFLLYCFCMSTLKRPFAEILDFCLLFINTRSSFLPFLHSFLTLLSFFFCCKAETIYLCLPRLLEAVLRQSSFLLSRSEVHHLWLI